MTAFLLNGAARQEHFPPGRTVLDYLRLQARLTGTKEGCAEGDCGACTIVLGRAEGAGVKFSAVNACLMLAADLQGCLVLTAEGIAEGEALHSVQQALVDLHGSQCGFCTPGFVTSLYAHGQGGAGDDEALLDALAGNLCRCTGYRPILAAARAVPAMPDARIPAWAAALAALPREDTAPQTLGELDALLAAVPETKLYAGCTDIGVNIAKHGHVPENLVSLRRVAALHRIHAGPEFLEIGAAAPYADILPHLDTHFPGFAKIVRRIGAVQIRNLGSMGGNLCNASPIGDAAPCLIALEATLILRSAAGVREIGTEDFFAGYRKTVLGPGEYLAAIRLPYLQAGEVFHAYKLAKRFDQDISTVAGAFKLRIEGGRIMASRIGFGGMAATPLRVRALEAALAGQACEPGIFASAAAMAATVFTPISDMRASAAYRVDAAAGFLRRLGAALAGEPADIWAL